MPSALAILAVLGVIGVVLTLLFVVQTLIAPRLVAGTLSEAQLQVCNEGKQWVLYDCEPNPLTRLGCIIPGSDGEFLTYKTVSKQISPCISTGTGSTGERVVSFKWKLQAPPTACQTFIDGGYVGPTACCSFNSSCARRAIYLCVHTSEPKGGESQCTPSYLPAPYPQFDAVHNDYTLTPVILDIPCRENYCSVPK